MREAPILFNQAMMPRVLDGSKTQTRRPVKLIDFGKTDTRGYDFHFRDKHLRWHDYDAKRFVERFALANVGDVLWVRETFYCDVPSDDPARLENLYYRADVPSGRFQDAGYWGEPGTFWRPSIHMPRWASRVTLPLVSVRVERVSDITDAAAIAEGFQPVSFHSLDCESARPRDAFLSLWRDIYGTAEWCFVYEWSKAVIAGGSRE